MRLATSWKACALLPAALLLFWGAAPEADNVLRNKPAARESFKRTEIPFPDDNPYSQAKSDLGRLLFFDPILSGSQSRSCSNCHNPGLSWGDGLPQALGERQIPLTVRSPTLIDIAWIPRLGWDGKFESLEAVTFGPITGKGNMNLPRPEVLVSRLAAIPGYVTAFNTAFGVNGMTPHNVELALATYQRTLVATEAPFDRWVNGDETAIDAAAKRGFDLFVGKARCAECHGGPAFTDGSFHDIGTAKGDDIGRGQLFPSSVKLRYAFKTPTLRDVARRGPYMHDGSIPTLEAVIALYNRGGIERPSRSPKIHPLGLSDKEKSDLLVFLRSLNGAPEAVPVPVLPR